MSNYMKFCSCKMCRHGLHCSKRSKAQVRRVVRSARQQTRIAIHTEKYDEIPQVVSVGYTD